MHISQFCKNARDPGEDETMEHKDAMASVANISEVGCTRRRVRQRVYDITAAGKQHETV